MGIRVVRDRLTFAQRKVKRVKIIVPIVLIVQTCPSIEKFFELPKRPRVDQRDSRVPSVEIVKTYRRARHFPYTCEAFPIDVLA